MNGSADSAVRDTGSAGSRGTRPAPTQAPKRTRASRSGRSRNSSTSAASARCLLAPYGVSPRSRPVGAAVRGVAGRMALRLLSCVNGTPRVSA